MKPGTGKTMKIIDFEKKGNVVKFILGKDDLEDWGGDDWDDAPYEHNAELVGSEFVAGVREVAFPYRFTVLEPKEEWTNHGNSPYCKDDMKSRKVPCIVALEDAEKFYWDVDGEFQRLVADDHSIKFYFGDKMEASDKLETWEKK